MAKYARHDPRNKKKGRHKSFTLWKEKRIREEDKGGRRKLAIDETFFDSEEKEDLQPDLDVVYYTHQE